MLMRGRAGFALFAASAAAIAAPAQAAVRSADFAIPAGPLSATLNELGRQAGVNLLFRPEAVRGLSSPAVRGRMSVEAALRRLLGGTNLTIRRAASGAFIVEGRAGPAAAAPAAARSKPTPSPPAEEPPVPEILIIGRRTQNVDIRRQVNDVQPYRVATGRQIVQAHRDTLDQFFQSRVTSNTQVVSPSLFERGETLSEIDLRGLGSDGTLVLVDGRRLPSIPRWTTFAFEPDPEGFRFRQPDVNAIPLHAIERVETLTGTAGGIYGFGALGGVVNVVLKRDYRGVELHGTAGISSRGDAGRLSLEGRAGFTPNDGRTDVMLYFSHAQSDPLRVGDRHYAVRDLEQTLRFVPERFLAVPPTSNSVLVTPLTGNSLTFREEYGGGPLGAGYTFLPAGFAGSPAEMVRALRQRAGQFDFTLSEVRAASGLGSAPELTAGIVNVRHRFGAGLEGYFDALLMRNSGRHTSYPGAGTMFVPPDSTINPFNESILLRFPLPEASDHHRRRFTTSRYTAGMVGDLPLRGWRATAEATFGSMRADVLQKTEGSTTVFLGPPLGPDLNPLGNWEEFQRNAVIDRFSTETEAHTRSRYREQSLRLAGPLLRAPGGLVNLSLLAERRSERVPAFTTVTRFESAFGGGEIEVPTGARGIVTTSFYGELRAPLLGHEGAVPLLDGLELQLAARHDRLRTSFDPHPEDPETDEIAKFAFRGTSFTAGAKAFPLPWLMLRGSYATGEAQPPPMELLIREEGIYDGLGATDPQRGDSPVGSEAPFLRRFGGSPDLGPARARTLSIGAVLNPSGERGPRVSLDYSRITKSREGALLHGQYVLDHEGRWPERVERGPLSDQDRALGYTGGVIEVLDESAINLGGVRVESLDGQFDWAVPFVGGRLRLYGAATLQISNKQRQLLDAPLEQVGFRQGPLKWRANVGADWSAGRTTLGANVQYFSRYRIQDAFLDSITDDVSVQGSPWVKSQAYLDLHASRSFALRNAGPLRRFSIDFAIVNVLDTAPPREAGYFYNGPGYSRYGDPRRRRFEVVLSSGF